MHRRVDPDTAVQAAFSVTTLDKTTRTAYNAIDWQSDIFSIRKDTFNPVINLKVSTANRTPGLTWLRIYTLVQAEWAC